MFIRLTNFRIRPGHWEQNEWGFKKASIAGRFDPGLRQRWLVRSAEDPDLGYLLSVWDSKESIDAYVRTHLPEDGSLPFMEKSIEGEYSVTHGEVRFLYDSPTGQMLSEPRW